MKRKSADTGFSLIELMVSLAISSFVIVACYQLYINQFKTTSGQLKTTSSQSDLRTVADTMAKHIEQATFNVRPSLYFSPLATFTSPSTQIGFNIDRNEDGTISGVGEYIEYAYNSSTQELFTKIDPSGAQILIMDKVSSFSIKYYDDLVLSAAGNEIATPATDFDRIERIRFKITKKIPDLTKDSANWKTRSILRDVVPLNIY